MAIAEGELRFEVMVCSSAPELLSWERLLPAEFATQTSPVGSMAIATGVPPTTTGEPLQTLPLFWKIDSVEAPLLATQALPLASRAIAVGALRLFPENGEPAMGTPVWASTVTVLLPALATQILPPASTAVELGVAKPAAW